MATVTIKDSDPSLTYALITQGANRWNGSTMAAISGIATSAFATGLVALTKISDSDGAFMNQYTMTVPPLLPASTSAYQVGLYGGNTPSDFRSSFGEIYWNGT